MGTKPNKNYSVAAFIGLIVLFFFSACTHPADKDFRDFQRTVKAKIDPLARQSWAVATIIKHPASYKIENSQLPPYIRQIGETGNAEGLVCEWNNIKPDVLVLMWGGGFGSWGLIVGDKSYTRAMEDDSSRVVPWTPGVYFFRGKH